MKVLEDFIKGLARVRPFLSQTPDHLVVVLMFTHPGHAAYFGGYDILKRLVYPSDVPTQVQSPAVHFLSGVFSNFIGGIIWNPQDVVKQRMQVQDNRRGEVGRYRNSWHCLRSVVKEEGPKGLFRVRRDT